MPKNHYKMKAKVWLYPGMAGWHFVTLPKKQSAEIKSRFGLRRRGWGSLPVRVTIGKTSWKTSIFPDRRADGRKKEKIAEGDTITFLVEIRV